MDNLTTSLITPPSTPVFSCEVGSSLEGNFWDEIPLDEKNLECPTTEVAKSLFPEASLQWAEAEIIERSSIKKKIAEKDLETVTKKRALPENESSNEDNKRIKILEIKLEMYDYLLKDRENKLNSQALQEKQLHETLRIQTQLIIQQQNKITSQMSLIDKLYQDLISQKNRTTDLNEQ